MLKVKLIEKGIPELGPIVTMNSFQPVGMLIVQPQSQALKVLKHFILTFKEENPRVTRIVINDDKNIPLAAHGANPRGINSVHMEQLFGLLSHHGVNQRMGSSDHLAMMIRAQIRLLSNFSKGNPQSRPKPLSRYNKSKLR
jgi:hypothetical protein